MADDKDGREASGKNKRAWRETQNSERAREHEEDPEAGSDAEPRPEADEADADEADADDEGVDDQGADEADAEDEGSRRPGRRRRES